MKTQYMQPESAETSIPQVTPMTTPHTLSSFSAAHPAAFADVANRHPHGPAQGSSNSRPALQNVPQQVPMARASLHEILGSIPGVVTGASIHTFPGSAHRLELPRGALSEISGSLGGGKTEIALELLSKASEVASASGKFRVAWIEPRLTLYPPALAQRGFELQQFFCVEAPELKEALWCAHQLLKSRLFEAVVLKPALWGDAAGAFSEVDLRRLQIAARKADRRMLFLPERPTVRGAWSLALQIKVENRKVQRLRANSSSNSLLSGGRA